MSAIFSATADEIERLDKLAADYGIAKDDPDRWKILALLLSRQYARGFNKPGHDKWDSFHDVLLLMAFHRGGDNVSAASEKLAKEAGWQNFTGTAKSTALARTLRRRFYKLIKRGIPEIYFYNNPAHAGDGAKPERLIVRPKQRGRRITK